MSKSLSEKISYLVSSGNMKCFNHPILDFLLDEVTINLDMLCPLAKHWICNNV